MVRFGAWIVTDSAVYQILRARSGRGGI